MSRPEVSVQPVTAELQPAFTELWLAARVEGGSTPDAALRAASEGRIADALAREDVTRLPRPRSAARSPASWCSPRARCPGSSTPRRVAVDQLYVVPECAPARASRTPSCRRAAGFAETLGCEQIATCVPAQAREANRFFARLGFSS